MAVVTDMNLAKTMEVMDIGDNPMTTTLLNEHTP